MDLAEEPDLSSDTMDISSSEGDAFHDEIGEPQLITEQANYRKELSRREEVEEFSRALSHSIPVHLIPRDIAQRLAEALQDRLLLLQGCGVSIHDVRVGAAGFLGWDGMPQAQAIDSLHHHLQRALKLFEEANMVGALLRHELKVKGSLRIEEAQRNDISIHDIRYENFLPTWDDGGTRDLAPASPPPNKPAPGPVEQQEAVAIDLPQTPEAQSMPFASNRGPFFGVEDFSATESSSDGSEDDGGSDVFDLDNNVRALPAPYEANIIHDVEMIGCEGGPQIVDLEVYLATYDEDDEDNSDSPLGGDIEMAVDREAFAAVHGNEGFVDMEIMDEDGALVQMKFADDGQGEDAAAGGDTPAERAGPLPLFPRVTHRVILEEALALV